MAVFAAYIQKRTQFQGQPTPFGNTYHYETAVGEEFFDEDLLDALVAFERPTHSTDVTFVEGRTWGPIGEGEAASVTRLVKAYSGTGNLTGNGVVYRECAFMIEWPLGRYGTRNREQYLRKFIHSCDSMNLTNENLEGVTPITNPPGPIVTYANAVTSVTVSPGVTYELCTASGRTPIDPPALDPFFEHHQFGR